VKKPLDARTLRWCRKWLQQRQCDVHWTGLHIPAGGLGLRETILAQSEAYGNAARDLPAAAKALERKTKAVKR
jgi:hypothetical protein